MPVRAVFVKVDEAQNRMILSQKQVQQDQLLAKLEPGQEVEVRLRCCLSVHCAADARSIGVCSITVGV